MKKYKHKKLGGLASKPFETSNYYSVTLTTRGKTYGVQSRQGARRRIRRSRRVGNGGIMW